MAHCVRKVRLHSPEVLVLLIPAVVKLLLHIVAINGYGLNGDELYYLACSDHLDWGYVDHPALSIGLLHLERLLFGDAVISLRFLPAVAGSLTVLMSGLLARRFGAGSFGQLLAALCALLAPVYLAVDHIFSMNAFDVLFWTAALYLLIRIIDDSKPVLWVWFGIVMGLGFENKISVLFLGCGIVAGLLLTPQRRLLLDRWAWISVVVMIASMLPYILWQTTHNWATLEWMHNARTEKMVALSPLSYLGQQVLLLGPPALLVWGTGVAALIVTPRLARYRSIGWCYITVLVVFIVLGGKPYYLSPLYPVLFAGGSCAIEGWLGRPWMRSSLAGVIVCVGILFGPMALPVLPVETFLKYQGAIGWRVNSGENSAEGRLPFFQAYFLGWKELVSSVDSVYRTLPIEDRKQCGIYSGNYAIAGAIDFYGKEKGLPRAISGHNNYWLWGTRGYSAEVMIIVGGSVEELQKTYVEVSERARCHNEYVQPFFSDLPIFVVRKLKHPLERVWPGTKDYI
jgi:hypothetical protein